MAAAPGDVFDVSVGIANNVEGSGKNAEVSLELAPSERLAVQGQSKIKITVPEGGEAGAKFSVKALEKPGSAELRFIVSLGDKESKASVDLSLRPASPYITSVAGGYIKDKKADVPVVRRMYPDFRVLEASYSTVPLGLARGLINYLNKFPHGCTEQLISQAFPPWSSEPGGLYRPKVAPVWNGTIKCCVRAERGGAFGFWAANSHIRSSDRLRAAFPYRGQR